MDSYFPIYVLRNSRYVFLAPLFGVFVEEDSDFFATPPSLPTAHSCPRLNSRMNKKTFRPTNPTNPLATHRLPLPPLFFPRYAPSHPLPPSIMQAPMAGGEVVWRDRLLLVLWRKNPKGSKGWLSGAGFDNLTNNSEKNEIFSLNLVNSALLFFFFPAKSPPPPFAFVIAHSFPPLYYSTWSLL